MILLLIVEIGEIIQVVASRTDYITGISQLVL